jgi:hypothetical protein
LGNQDRRCFEKAGARSVAPVNKILRIEMSKKGRGGKTVTVGISGFQHNEASLAAI